MRTEKNQEAVFPPRTPAELEELNQAAQAAQQRMIRLVKSMKQARGSAVQICAESIGAPEERDVNRLIWHGIVRYANADITNASGVGEAFSAFYGFGTLCVMRLRDPLEVAYLPDLSFDDLESLRAAGTLTTFEGFHDACCKRLSSLHQQFRVMLTWLADPNGCSRVQRRQAINFLVEHGGEGAIDFDLFPNDDVDDTGKRGAPYFYWKTASSYTTILSPVAKFILDRIEQYQTDEKRVRLTLSKAIPVLACKRPACRRFAVLRRKTRDFCSASCRSLYRQESNLAQHAAYQRDYREKNYKKQTNAGRRR